MLRSGLVLDDRNGELLAPFLSETRGAMPRFAFTAQQVSDLAAFLHSFYVYPHSEATKLDVLVGDATRGAGYVAAKCGSCHTTESLTAFARKVERPIDVQQMWLMPGSGLNPAEAPVPAPPLSVTVTRDSGEVVEGRLDYVDDYRVRLTQADGRRLNIDATSAAVKVVIRNPLQPHIDLLPTYADAEIHDITAYLVSLKSPR